jgi:hypothetical protein
MSKKTTLLFARGRFQEVNSLLPLILGESEKSLLTVDFSGDALYFDVIFLYYSEIV